MTINGFNFVASYSSKFDVSPNLMRLRLEKVTLGPRGECSVDALEHDVFADHVEHPVKPGFRAAWADALIRASQ